MQKEEILRRVMKDLETTGDMYWLYQQLERMYITRLVQDNILKVINNRHYKKNVPKIES